MRILILDNDYPAFVRSLYAQNPGLEHADYATQAAARADSLTGLADFYSAGLRALGHEAWDLSVNVEPLQRAWLAAHGLSLPAQWPWRIRWRRGIVPTLTRDRWLFSIVEQQVKHLRPDVLINRTLDWLPETFIRRLKPYVKLVVGHHAAPTPFGRFKGYDGMVSAALQYVDYFRQLGLKTEWLPYAFAPRVRQAVPPPHPAERSIPVSFVGSFSRFHLDRIRLVEYLCERTPIQVFGTAERLAPNSPIRARLKPAVWGTAMYRVLAQSRITLNTHGIPDQITQRPTACNMRMYEATGMGALLLTDDALHLERLFDPTREVAVWHSPQDCAAQIEHYLAHESERQAIAHAGQARTLRDHTFDQRMAALAELLQSWLRDA